MVKAFLSELSLATGEHKLHDNGHIALTISSLQLLLLFNRPNCSLQFSIVSLHSPAKVLQLVELSNDSLKHLQLHLSFPLLTSTPKIYFIFH
jgi:hypothetical protein